MLGMLPHAGGRWWAVAYVGALRFMLLEHDGECLNMS
jgi:hypothetical protein